MAFFCLAPKLRVWERKLSFRPRRASARHYRGQGELDASAGRNHHPIAFSTVLAGGGVRGGQAYGATDPTGREVASNKVSVHDFNATIAQLMGVDYSKSIVVPGGRGLTLAGADTSPNKGKPIAALV